MPNSGLKSGYPDIKQAQSPEEKVPSLRYRDAAELLLSLDKLMTIGSYYQPGHARHQAVTEECLTRLRKATGEKLIFEFEITADGVEVMGEHFPAPEREARRLFSLLNPLGVSVLELHAGITGDELHEAIGVLQQTKQGMTGARSYEEIVIDGLPSTVTTVNRGLYLKTKGDGGAGPGHEPLHIFDHNIIPAELLADGADQHKSEHEFLKIISGVIEHTGKKLQQGEPGKKSTRRVPVDHELVKRGDWIPQEALLAIQNVIKSLAGTNSDPMVFEHLIQHAKTALKMTGDPELVELVFEKLRKDVRAAATVQPKLIDKKRGAGNEKKQKYAMSAAGLAAAIDALNVPIGPVENPVVLDRANFLSICLQVLRTAPSDDLAEGVIHTLKRMMAASPLPRPERLALAQVICDLLAKPLEGEELYIFRQMWEVLHEFHPRKVGPLWSEIWRTLPAGHRGHAWPHVVNDILLGLEWDDPAQALRLYEQVSELKAVGQSSLLYQLENLPALAEGLVADDLFKAPPPLLFPIHQVLVGSSRSPVHGPLLHEHLLDIKPHKLTVVMLEAMTEYHPGNRVVYHAILDQGVAEKVTPRMHELGSRLLTLALERLSYRERRQGWIKDAIKWLSILAPVGVRKTFDAIVKDRHWLILPAWPKEHRLTAKQAWLDMHDRERKATREE